MTCPECEADCGLDNECECDCHEEENTLQATVMENQSIEYETDVHLADSSVIMKTRIFVTGRNIEEAHKQFERVRIATKT